MGNSIFSGSADFITVGGSTYYLTSMKLDKTAKEIDTTNTGTTGDGTEFKYGRVDRAFSIEYLFDRTKLDIPIKTASLITMSFDGKTYVGSGSFNATHVIASIDDVVKCSADGKFNGAVTESTASAY